MKELQIFMTDKQIDYVKRRSELGKVTFNEALRQIVEGFQKYERIEEIQRFKEGKI